MSTEDQKTKLKSEQVLQLVVVGTFTLDPLRSAMDFWSEELSLSVNVTFAPYTQVQQELLLDSSLLRTNTYGLNIVLVRLVDWQIHGEQYVSELDDTPENRSAITENTTAFIEAVQGAIPQLGCPLLTIICPSTSETSSISTKEFLLALERNIEEQLVSLTGVDVISVGQMKRQYPVTDYLDPQANEVAHIPYTQMFYSMLGTVITRRLHRLYSLPCKIIMVDADNTLWNGICGEVGAQGIQINADFLAFQEYLIQQIAVGRLVCVVSKNSEEDVRAVFEQRSDMLLRLEHVTAISANWHNKSENIRRLVQDLNLGLDSVVFLDDDPISCAEVIANCPAVLTFQLPDDTGNRMDFLNHLWALDKSIPTQLTQNRTALYHDQFLRETYRRSSPSLADFLAGLNLDVQVTPVSEVDYERVSELTYRTNQFNCTTKRRSTTDITRMLSSDAVFGSVVRVTDRFGDYGLVGVLFYEITDVSLLVDTMLLSCRTLGRGVEHEMVAFLGQQAEKASVQHVILPFMETTKNQPAKDFLYSIASEFVNQRDVELQFVLPASMAATLSYQPTKTHSKDLTIESDEAAKKVRNTGYQDQQESAEQLRSIAQYLSNPDEIHEAIASMNVIKQDVSTPFVAPATDIDQQILDICADILGVNQLGMNDNFFNLGIHSLLIMQIISQIQEQFDIALPIQSFFLAPTVTGVSQALAGYMANNDVDDLSEAVASLSAEDLASIADNFSMLIPEEPPSNTQS